MDADGTPADGFEFNLTRVLEMLDERAASATDRIDQPGRRAAEFLYGLDRARAALDSGLDSAQDVGSDTPLAQGPVTPPSTPTADAGDPTGPPVLAPLPHRVPGANGLRTQPDDSIPTLAPSRPPSAGTLPTRTPRVPAGEALPTRSPSAPGVGADERPGVEPAARPDGLAALHRVVGGTDLSAAAADPAPVLPPPVPQAPANAETATTEQRVKMPTIADVRQFQRAQYRQARRSRKGKLAGRVMLTFMVVAGATAAALTIGRTYLFPADWADELVPVVDEIEAARGVEFEEVVEVVEASPDAYTTSVSHAMFGTDPAGRMAVWRALGVASGEFDATAVAAALVDVHPAVFDGEHGRIVKLEGRSVDMRALLHRALDVQLGAGVASGTLDVLGPLPVTTERAAPDPASRSATPGSVAAGSVGELGAEQPTTIIATADGVVESINDHASDAVAIDPSLESSVPPAAAGVDPTTLTDALPIAYQAAAGDRLVPELTLAAGSQAADRLAALNDGLRRAPDATLDAGDVAVSGPVGLGIDDWTLVWTNRLPADAVDTLVAGTTADSIQTFRRGEALCVAAVFGTANEVYATAALEFLARWAAAAPAEAQAAVAQLTPTFVQLTTCDPGPTVAQTVNATAIENVIGRQVARLDAAGTPAP